MESWNFSWNFFQVFIFTETFSIFCCCLGVDQRVFQGPFWVAWFLLHWGGSGRPKLLQKNPRLERQQGSDELFPWHHARRGTGKTARMRQLFRPLFWGTHGQYCFKFNVSCFFLFKEIKRERTGFHLSLSGQWWWSFYSRHQEESLHKEHGRANGFPWERGSAFPVFPNDAMIWDEWQNRGLDGLWCFTIGFSVIFLEILTPGDVLLVLCPFFPIFFFHESLKMFIRILWVHPAFLKCPPCPACLSKKVIVDIHTTHRHPLFPGRCSDPGDVCRALVP